MKNKELLGLLEMYKNEPENLDLINKIAIGYSHNNEMCRNNEDYKFFEKAYKIKKTIKSTHNFASYLFYEQGKNKKAEKIQRECMKLEPKSIYPYLLLSEILIENKKIGEAVEILEIAKNIENSYNIQYNLGYCKYHLKKYYEAKVHFLNCIGKNDKKLMSMFGNILVDYRLGNKEEVYNGILKMKKSNFFENALNDYDVGIFYYLYNDFEKAKDLYIELEMNIDITDRQEYGYSIFKTDINLFNNIIEKDVNKLKSYIKECENDSSKTSEEKKENIDYWLSEIDRKKYINEKFKRKPRANIDKQLSAEYFGCSINGCCFSW